MNNTFLSILINCILCFIDIYMFYEFQQKIFCKKSYSKLNKCLVILTVLIAIILINNLHNSLINLFFIPCLYIILNMLLFEGSSKKKISTTIYFILLFIIAEFCMNIIVNVSGHAEIINVFDYAIVSFIVKSITFLLLKITLKFISSDVNKESSKWSGLALFLPFTTILVLSSIFYSGINNNVSKVNGIFLIMASFCLMIANIIIFLLFEKMSTILLQTMTLQLINEKNNFMDKHYAGLSRMQKEQTVFIHNIHHYINMIHTLMSLEDYKKISEIENMLQIKLDKVSGSVYCNHNIMNALLIEKTQQTQNEDIKFTINLEPDFMISFMEDYDLIAMIGNLIDNAIEAASQCKDNREIYLEGFMANNYTFAIIEIKNTYQVKPMRKGEKFITIKQDTDNHGIGIEFIRNTAEKYGGILDIDIKDDFFIVTLILATELSH